MRRDKIYKLLKLISIVLLIAFIIRVLCDYYLWSDANSMPFIYNVLFRSLEFLIPSFISFIIALFINRKIVHEMNLEGKYFDYIKNGTKRVEIRLNDEKRKKINIRDSIIFHKLLDNDSIRVLVTNLTYFDSFDSLIEYYEKKTLADVKEDKDALKDALYKFYTKKEEVKYGVLGIEFKLENN